jgi:acyl-CoA synthetase (AMP-forming)/AMP-acid ligase II
MIVPFSVCDFLDRAVQVYGDRVGIVDEPSQPADSLGELSYAEVGRLARRQAARLDELGLGVGERVAIVSHNSARLLVSFFGVSGWGRVLVPINFRLSPDEVRYIVKHSGARVLLVDPELAESLRDVEAEFTFVLGDDSELYARAPEDGGPEPHSWLPDENAIACINYTSGTEILKRIRDHGVTVLCAAPAVAAAVLDAAQTWEGEIPGRDRVRIIMAGAPPPTKTITRVQQELGWEFIQIYGLTETSPLLTFNRTRAEWDELSPEEKATKLGRAGAPALGVRLDVSTDDASAGEILARSNVVLDGYWQQPEETAESLRDGWFHTGDGGVVGDDGYLTISDRRKDVIITGGENVSSIEVEDMLYSHPAVAEVAVIGIPSERWGETLMALVVLAPGQTTTEAELVAWCKEKAAGFKAPKAVEFRTELPRTATGKLQKFKLRAPYWQGYDRQVN